MAEYKQLSDGRPDGFLLGKDSADKMAFYGGTPTTQAATIDAVLSTVISTAATNSSPWGFATSAQANAIVDVVEDLRDKIDAITAELRNKNFISAT
jgi:hypothetical protein